MISIVRKIVLTTLISCSSFQIKLIELINLNHFEESNLCSSLIFAVGKREHLERICEHDMMFNQIDASPPINETKSASLSFNGARLEKVIVEQNKHN